MKLTKWFPAYIKPVRRGVYETRIDSFHNNTPGAVSRWNGKRWSHQIGKNANKIYLRDFGEAAAQNKSWRGLAKEPK